ncbi:MAG: DNA primase [Gemmatimonadales bacterium]
MIPDELIEQIKDSADLVGVIGESVGLKKSGADWRGPCPFHGGTHRNFAVIPKKGLYYCYVCHAAGDVFSFLMKRFGMDYPTAVRDVARRVGITVPDRAERQGPDPREPLFQAVAVAQEWFAARLRESPDAENARRYLEGRDLPLVQAAELGLGYAPSDKSFQGALAGLGVTEPVLVEAGLVVRRDDGSVGPRFRGRLLFPIRDLRGRVVAFGGRLLGPGEPKYLNSPETPIFHKGSTLYHLHEARHAIRKEGVAILVEGYFDALRPALAGIEHVVAPLGTALTAEQAALLARYAPAAILLYDSDAAGLRATFRAGDELLRHGVRVRVATLPPGQDPDSLVRAGGKAALEAILEDAVDLLERKIQLLERKGWFSGVERRRDALDKLLPTVRAAKDPIAKDLYLGRVAEVTGVSRGVLEQELAARVAAPPPPAPVADRTAPPRRPGRRRDGARWEGRLLQVLISEPSWLDRAREVVTTERFEVPAFREIYAALLALAPSEGPLRAAEQLTPAALDVWHRLVQSAQDLGPIDWDAEYSGALQALDDRDRMRSLPSADDVDARREGLQQLSPEARVRLTWRKQAGRGRPRSTDARAEG